MPRRARKQSNLKIHHVILRGINRQIIFEDQYDYKYFISCLQYYKDLCHFKLYAYCLMDNHIHLLLEETDTVLEIIMKRIEVKFVKWYNQKYQRTGHLFQDRFRSEPVNDIRYFITVFRYIHQNPLHANLESVLGTYHWSSYNDYLTNNSQFIDIDTLQQLFPTPDECIKYLNCPSHDACMDDTTSTYLLDSDALKIILQRTSCTSPADFQKLDMNTRDRYLRDLYGCGISGRQLSRLTGISRRVIASTCKGASRDRC